MAKKMNMRAPYKAMTRLGWEPRYQPRDKIFPHDKYEGIRIHDWDAWEDPFRMTMDAFAQNNGHPNLSDGCYVNALKLFLQGVSPLEYQAHRGFARMGRHFEGEGARVACQMQALDELRHVQTQVHTLSH